MKWHYLLFTSLLTFTTVLFSCKSEKSFEINGRFSSADKETLFLEHRGLGGIQIIDSVKLKDDGVFRFKEKSPENPEFYQLRINNQIVFFAIDSTETLHVEGDIKELSKTFTVKDSPVNDQIREINILTQNVKSQINEMEKKHTSKEIDDMAYLERVDSVLNRFKTETTKIILGNPSGAAAYYAVFQKINNYLIFDPYNRQDYAMYGAVATSWDKYYPGTTRTKHLYDFTMNALRARRIQEQQTAMFENIPVVTDTSLTDIVLKEVNGENKDLAALKGKVVILDFTVYNSQFSPKHNIDLNRIYNQYQSKGLEIYQISFDSDEHFWKNAANNLPWITVRDPQSVNSRLLAKYNVREIPIAFVVDRKGDIVARVENYSTLQGEVEKVL